jgi:hypothetical protein
VSNDPTTLGHRARHLSNGAFEYEAFGVGAMAPTGGIAFERAGLPSSRRPLFSVPAGDLPLLADFLGPYSDWATAIRSCSATHVAARFFRRLC